MKRIWMLIFVVSVVGMAPIGVGGCSGAENYKLKRNGNQVIAQIENFRSVHGHLPSRLDDLEISYDTRLFYEKREHDSYVVWFGKRVGESELYDSRERDWKTTY